jgi:hypothetical protein
MWTRIIGSDGGVVSPKVLACYRRGAGSATTRLVKQGKTINDILKTHELFAARYGSFDPVRANGMVCDYALAQAKLFESLDDRATALEYYQFWHHHADATMKLKHSCRAIYRTLVNSYRKIRGRQISMR